MPPPVSMAHGASGDGDAETPAPATPGARAARSDSTRAGRREQAGDADFVLVVTRHHLTRDSRHVGLPIFGLARR